MIPGPDDCAAYRAPRWFAGAHAQTIGPFLLRRSSVCWRRERVEIGDGDFWLFDWLDMNAAASAPLLVLFHGLEGGSQSHYARGIAAHATTIGWRMVVPHFRGCGGEPNRLPRAYHSADHAEIGAMLAAVRTRSPASAALYAAGVSLGGSALVNWLGRAGAAAANVVDAAAAVSTPLDLMASGLAIGRGANRVYTWHFLHDLKPKALAMARRFPGMLDATRIARARSMWDFDDAVTAPLHGFAGTRDYWVRGSSKAWLARVRVPTLVINATNDPFIPRYSLPGLCDVSASVTLEQPATGGHAGFAAGPFPGTQQWLPRRLVSFFSRRG
ncbi:MAG: alpha/beta fold hydrolase [Casimicrobiaceae bacterium]